MSRPFVALLSRVGFWLALGVGLLGSVAPAHAGSLSSDLRALISSNPLSLQPVPVIVRYSRKGVNGNLLALSSGGWLTGNLKLINGGVMMVPRCLVSALASNSAVSGVSLDVPIAARDAYVNDAATATTGAPPVWSGAGLATAVTGTGVRIAILDTGISPSADFAHFGASNSRIVSFVDLVNGQSSPYDDNGHGTHVAGIALGSGNQSGGVISGEAPDADLVSVKVLGQDGSGATSTAIQGLDWCVDNHAALGIKVINMSLGHPATESCQTDPLCAAVRGAVQSGMVVVCAAGNDGLDSSNNTFYGGIETPGIEPSAITVGSLNTQATASRSDDSVDSYSSRGPTYQDNLPKPDLVAPGNRILSVRAPGSYLDTNYPSNQVQFPGSATTDYFELSGTSMASPQVAGIAALMLQANANLQPNAVKAILMYTAQNIALYDGNGAPLSPLISMYTEGAGSINALGAVLTAETVDPTAPVGQPWLSTSLPGQTTLGGVTFAWSQQVAWGTTLLSGADLLGLNQPAWAGQTGWNSSSGWSGSVTATSDPSPQPGDPAVPTPVEAQPGQITWSDSTLHGD